MASTSIPSSGEIRKSLRESIQQTQKQILKVKSNSEHVSALISETEAYAVDPGETPREATEMRKLLESQNKALAVLRSELADLRRIISNTSAHTEDNPGGGGDKNLPGKPPSLERCTTLGADVEQVNSAIRKVSAARRRKNPFSESLERGNFKLDPLLTAPLPEFAVDE
jgi:DNA-binding FadR family transcriptional regulator